MLDMAPKRRQLRCMLDSSKNQAIRPLDRINLRLSPETLEAIDQARSARPGNVSRNTWIAEAIKEKLERDDVLVDDQAIERKRHA
jgi:predicted HicB family RNase H-like nuclease